VATRPRCRCYGWRNLSASRIVRPHSACRFDAHPIEHGASWVPTERVPLLADIYRTLGTLLSTLPFGGTKPPLGCADDFRREMGEAEFSNITVLEVEHTLEVPSVEAFWIGLARSTPPIHAVREHLGPERWERVAHQLVESLRAKWGDGPQQPQQVPMIANLATGVR